jgi:uncharacterized membrane protein
MKKSLVVVPLFILLLFISIILNIPVIRQIIAFIFLTFVPGFVILKILKLREIGVVDSILFSIGLSIAFSIFVGLLLNQLLPIFGILQPLSTYPLVITFGISTLAFFIIGYRKDISELSASSDMKWNVKKAAIAKSAILFLPLLFGSLGALYLNTPLLLLAIATIAILLAFAGFSTRIFPSKYYSLIIFAFSMALVFHVVLTSKYIMGSDSQLEYYVFKLTETNGHWVPLENVLDIVTESYNSLLSITILPTVYSVFLNVSGKTVFKIFYPIVFSFVPVVLYRTYEYIGKLPSFFSTIFFISGSLVFYGIEPLSLDRQIVAQFFFVLSIFLLLTKKVTLRKTRFLLIIFGLGIMFSHYSLMYFYLVYVLVIYILSKIRREQLAPLTSTISLLFFLITFSWYTFTVAPFTSLQLTFSRLVIRFLGDFDNPAAKSTEVLGAHPILGIASGFNWVFFYAAHILIIVGLFVVTFKIHNRGNNPTYRLLAILSAFFIFLCVVIPNFSSSLNFSRFYSFGLLLLTPCFALGGEYLIETCGSISKRIKGRHSSENLLTKARNVLLITVLIGFFLSQSGFVNNISNASPLSYPLDQNRMRTSSSLDLMISYYSVYTSETDVAGSTWLLENDHTNSTIYADLLSRYIALTSEGLFPRQQTDFVSNTTVLDQGTFLFLGELNVKQGVISTDSSPFNTSKLSPLFEENNLIYSNGNCQIWRAPYD